MMKVDMINLNPDSGSLNYFYLKQAEKVKKIKVSCCSQWDCCTNGGVL